MSDPATRLSQARAAAGYSSARSAAEAMGVKYPTYIMHEQGTRGLNQEKAERYAHFYHTTPEWILFGRGDPPSGAGHPVTRPRPVSRQIPVMGEVAAGVWRAALAREIYDADEWLPVDVPGYERASLYALRVVGTSMNLVYPPGRYVIVAPVAEAGIREGDYVIVERPRDDIVELTVKEVVTEDARISLWPRSSDPIYQSPWHVRGDELDQTAPRIIGVVVGDYAKRDRPPTMLGAPRSE